MSSFKINLAHFRATNRLVPYPHGPWSPATFHASVKADDVIPLMEKYPEIHVKTLTPDKDGMVVVYAGVRGVWDCSRDTGFTNQQITDALDLSPDEFDRFIRRVPHSILNKFHVIDIFSLEVCNLSRLRQSQYFWIEEQRVETHHVELLQRAYDWVLEPDKLKRYRIAVSLVHEVYGEQSSYARENGSDRWTTKNIALKHAKRVYHTFVALCSPIVIPLLVMVRSPLPAMKRFLRRDGDHAIVTELAEFLHLPAVEYGKSFCGYESD